MPDRIIFPEFRDEFLTTRYPFADSATLQTEGDADLKIEVDTFLDGSLYPVGAGGSLYLASITVAIRKVTITLQDENRVPLASTTYDPLLLDDVDRLEFVDTRGRAAGILLTDALRLARFTAWPVGTHTFALGATEFAASVVIPSPQVGLRGLLTEADDLLAGDVWLVGDNGVVVTEDDGDIRVDIVGDPLFVRKLCGQVELFQAPNFITMINDCPPDAYGNYNLVAGDHLTEDTILRINPTDDGLIIEAVGDTVN